MKLRFFRLFFFATFALYQCKTDSGNTTRVSLHISAPIGTTIYLSRVPYTDEKNKTIDSAIAKGMMDSIIFHVPLEPDRLYTISVKNSTSKFQFIADGRHINIRTNIFSGQSEITGSQATVSLRNFNHAQNEIALHAHRIYLKADSLAKKNNPADRFVIDSLQQQFKDSIELIKKINLEYADTVKNPAAFLSVYSNMDFDNKDLKNLKELMERAAKRFPESQAVQKLKQETLDMVSIFEEEFNIGDTLPTIELADSSGKLYSTASLKGKYYLLDFWSTWCTRCTMYNQFKKEVKEKTPSDKFEMVSVALDDDKKTWSNLIRQYKYNWTQLIDEKMWRGTAAKTLKFDSIPFNFFVSPEGRILAKAIKPDSLVIVIERALH